MTKGVINILVGSIDKNTLGALLLTSKRIRRAVLEQRTIVLCILEYIANKKLADLLSKNRSFFLPDGDKGGYLTLFSSFRRTDILTLRFSISILNKPSVTKKPNIELE